MCEKYTCIHCGEGGCENISHGEGGRRKKLWKKGGPRKILPPCHNFWLVPYWGTKLMYCPFGETSGLPLLMDMMEVFAGTMMRIKRGTLFMDRWVGTFKNQTGCPFWGTNELPLLRNTRVHCHHGIINGNEGQRAWHVLGDNCNGLKGLSLLWDNWFVFLGKISNCEGQIYIDPLLRHTQVDNMNRSAFFKGP